MTNCARLIEKIDKSGLRYSFIAEKLGISRASLSYKLKGKRPFKAMEIQSIAQLLGLNDMEMIEIFFAKNVSVQQQKRGFSKEA